MLMIKTGKTHDWLDVDDGKTWVSSLGKLVNGETIH